MKQKMSTFALSSYRYALDIDGNAHSFNRPLAIARAGCTLLRVNVFTDLFDDGLLHKTHAFETLTPLKSELDADRVLEDLRRMPRVAQNAAAKLTEVHEWLTETALTVYMQAMIA